MRWLPLPAAFLASLLIQEPAWAATFGCDERGVLDAVARGGGPHRFACLGPTIIVTGDTIFIENYLILDGQGQLTLSGGGDHPVLFVEVGATVELRDLTISDGAADLDFPCCDGGGIRNRGHLTLVGCRIVDNTAGFGGGGGIFNSGFISGGQTTLTMIDTTVSRNLARLGGGISTNARATLVMRGSTISENESTVDTPTIRGGGGIFSNADLSIVNSTISSNVATFGGGISQQGGHLQLTNVTLSENSPDEIEVAGPVEVANTILDGRCSGQPVVSFGGNVEGPGDTCGLDHPADRTSVLDLLLGALGDNGGPSDTHALLPGSAAVDAGVDCPPPETDQRGRARPRGKSCDAGAYEAEFVLITVDIDIRPGSRENVINPFSHGSIPVAILGAEEVAVHAVDLSSLAFGPEGAPAVGWSRHRARDFDRNGRNDLLAWFRTAETGIALGDTEACLLATTVDGTVLRGCDAIRPRLPDLRLRFLAWVFLAMLWR